MNQIIWDISHGPYDMDYPMNSDDTYIGYMYGMGYMIFISSIWSISFHIKCSQSVLSGYNSSISWHTASQPLEIYLYEPRGTYSIYATKIRYRDDISSNFPQKNFF